MLHAYSTAPSIEMTAVRSYWKVENDALRGKQLVVPYLRFNVKNTGTAPITFLEMAATFEFTDKKEILGEGSQYVVTSSDAALKSGYTKEVFFGSGTGYTGYGILASRPAITAHVFVQTSMGGKKVELASFPVDTQLSGAN
jgi:hypothetical protein